MDPIAKLIIGFKAFRDGRFQDQRAAYQALVDQGQKPKVAIFACSDSRVDPAVVLQADPGDLFIVRNVANLVPPHERDGHFNGTSAALEYAVLHLEVGHLIVLGHAHCGGIRSLFEVESRGGEGNLFLPPWMSLVRSAFLRVEGTMPDAAVEEKARACEQSAVLVSLENLMTFPWLKEAVEKDELSLHGLWTDIGEGGLEHYLPELGAFEPV